MPGKWSGLKGTVPSAPVDQDFQQKVNLAVIKVRIDDDIRASDVTGPVDTYEDYPEQFTPFKLNTLTKTAKARLFCKIRDHKDQLETQVKELNVDLEALSQLLVHEMEGEGLDLFRLDSGDSLSIKDEPYCSVADKNIFINWIKDSRMEDLLTVHYQTLSAMTKQRLESGKPAPPGIKVFMKSSITRRRARG